MKLLAILSTFCVASLVHAQNKATDQDQPLPPIKPIARRIPPKGNDIGDANRAKIQKRLDEVTRLFRDLRTRPIASKSQTHLIKQLAADVDVYIKAVRFALLHGEFYAKGDIEKSLRLLDTAEQRIRALEKSQHAWTTQRGKVVRGYYSEIDGSPQPYGLEIPEKLDLSSDKKVPLYVWLHGRGDKVTDMHFIAQREKSGCPISPFVDDGIIVHPFGRHCVGYKGPGEIDVLDVIASVKERYNIDEDRVALLGFSMGGAGAWHIGAHYADQFCVVHAGAGFAETKEYIGLKKENYPPWYEQKLWGLYDVPNYTRNLFNTTVIAYSGENDKQIQAARVMERAFKAEGRTLQHIIGPGMGHKYDPESIKQIMAVVKKAVKNGRDRWPKEVYVQTQILRYGNQHWLHISDIEERWRDTRLSAIQTSDGNFEIKTKNVNSFWIPADHPALESNKVIEFVIDGQTVKMPGRALPGAKSVYEKMTSVDFSKRNGQWGRGGRYSGTDPGWPHKSGMPNVEGPIDEINMRPFLIVEPTGKFEHPAVERWVRFELEHFKSRWRALYRGNPRIKKDVDITTDDWRRFNFVLWGTPSSNSLIRRIHSQIPILKTWNNDAITVNRHSLACSSHVPMLIYPALIRHKDNEHLAEATCVSINAGITHREAHDRTNSLQNPKLPDWAIISLEKDPDAESPGVVKAAGFFDEQWKFKNNEPGVNER